jgi:serine/threonine-protein kinase
MGRLYEAEHTRLPRRLVVKVIHDVYAKSRDAVARFEREARAVARIDSDYVLQVVDVVRTLDDRPCIVAERLEGEDLQARLDRVERVSSEEALRIGRQLCRGLAAAHAQGVLHRDIKPSNIFLHSASDGRLQAKVLDFGVAKLMDAPDITRSGAVVGTPAYMAPEQARGAATVDRRADIYGVGAVMYRMLTGHSPHEAADATASLSRLLNESALPVRDLAPDLPEAVATLVDRVLSRDPRDRPPDAHALEAEISALLPPGESFASESIGESPTSIEDGRATADATLVLPSGVVSQAAVEAARRRRARVFTVAAAALTTVIGTLATLAITGGSGRLTFALGALVACSAAAAWTHGLKRRWRERTALYGVAHRALNAALFAVVALGLAVVWQTSATAATGAAPGSAGVAGWVFAIGLGGLGAVTRPRWRL